MQPTTNVDVFTFAMFGKTRTTDVNVNNKVEKTLCCKFIAFISLTRFLINTVLYIGQT